MSNNPFESPLVGGAEAMTYGIRLAGRVTRLVAVIIDTIVVVVLVLPIALVFAFLTNIDVSGVVGQIVGAVAGVGVYLAVNGSLLASNGQTIGKRAMGVKIVRTNGEKATFDRIVAYRLLPLWIASLIPYIGVLVGLVNVLLIFRANRKCLHDDIADTIVVVA